MSKCAAGLVVVFCLALPSLALAQGSITGTVRDSSGPVLPGVTVEVSSPALIETVRSAVTDGAGRYRVVDLRPGTYAVTFTLPGFNTVRREGIAIEGTFTATVDGVLGVGTLQEAVTVCRSCRAWWCLAAAAAATTRGVSTSMASASDPRSTALASPPISPTSVTRAKWR